MFCPSEGLGLSLFKSKIKESKHVDLDGHIRHSGHNCRIKNLHLASKYNKIWLQKSFSKNNFDLFCLLYWVWRGKIPSFGIKLIKIWLPDSISTMFSTFFICFFLITVATNFHLVSKLTSREIWLNGKFPVSWLFLFIRRHSVGFGRCLSVH